MEEVIMISEKEIEKREDKHNIVYPEFDDIKVSTKTIIVKVNIKIDLTTMVNSLPCTPYIIVPKRRGRKKKVVVQDPNRDIDSGSIITLKYKDIVKGVDLKRKETKSTSSSSRKKGFFRNSATVVMVVDGKLINFKVCHNGKFQMTGCKNDEQAEKVVKYMWNYIKDRPDIFTYTHDNQFEAIFVPAMRNIDFSLGFNVNKEELDKYINEHTEYTSLLETSFGYTGVNIKLPMKGDICNLKLKKMVYKTENKTENKTEAFNSSSLDISKDSWEYSLIDFKTYLSMLESKDRDKKMIKERNNTFLVFYSGKTIMSGICEEFQRDTYYEFINIIRKCKHIIREKVHEQFEERNNEKYKDSIVYSE